MTKNRTDELKHERAEAKPERKAYSRPEVKKRRSVKYATLASTGSGGGTGSSG